jgi:hypothetical protein
MSTLKYHAYASSVAIAGNTELASMPTGQGTFGNGGGLTSNVWDNTSTLWPEADFLLLLGSIVAPAGASVLLGLLWSIDGGTNFPDPQYASGQAAVNIPLGGTPTYTQAVLVSTSAKKIVFPSVKLRPGKAMFLIHNLTGVTLAASGNSLTMYPTTFDIS